MALVIADRVQETTTSTGTGTLTLAGPVSGFQSFAAIGNGNTTYYAIVSGTDWEVGIGTYTSSGTTLSRDTVLSSSAGGSTKITVASGATVFCDYPAGKAVYQDSTGLVSVPTLSATASTAASANKGAINYSTLGYSDTNILASFASSVAGYNQMILQNTSNDVSASTNFIVSNDAGTASTNYGEFGINSSTFSGTGSLGSPGAVYLTSASTDLVLGTVGANSIRFVINSGATDAATISSAGLLTANSFASSSAAITGGTINGTTIGASTASSGAFTSLSATGTTTLATSLSGLLKATSGVVSAATAGTDYVAVGGALGIPSSGTVTNLTGTASININGTVGATTASTGAFTTLSATGVITSTLATGTAPFTVASTTQVANLNAATAGTATSATTATNLAGGAVGSVPYQNSAGATLFLTGNTTTTPQFVTSTGTGTVAQAPTLTSSTGSGSVVLATSPTLVTPALGTPASGVVTNLTGTASININGTVGATTPTTGKFTTITQSAGTAGVGGAPIYLTTGTNLTAAAQGAIEFDGTALYMTPFGTSRGSVPTYQIQVLNATYTLTSQVGVQKLLNATTNGAVAVAVGLYEFECQFMLTGMSATSGTLGFALAGTATYTQQWMAHASRSGSAAATIVTGNTNAVYQTQNTAANTAITGSSTNTTGSALIKGFIRVTVAGTVIPQVSMSVASAAVVQTGAYFKITPISATSTTTNIGNWT